MLMHGVDDGVMFIFARRALPSRADVLANEEMAQTEDVGLEHYVDQTIAMSGAQEHHPSRELKGAMSEPFALQGAVLCRPCSV